MMQVRETRPLASADHICKRQSLIPTHTTAAVLTALYELH
jgi:hypothetical protein